jgi:hypothetical protein
MKILKPKQENKTLNPALTLKQTLDKTLNTRCSKNKAKTKNSDLKA